MVEYLDVLGGCAVTVVKFWPVVSLNGIWCGRDASTALSMTSFFLFSWELCGWWVLRMLSGKMGRVGMLRLRGKDRCALLPAPLSMTSFFLFSWELCGWWVLRMLSGKMGRVGMLRLRGKDRCALLPASLSMTSFFFFHWDSTGGVLRMLQARMGRVGMLRLRGKDRWALLSASLSMTKAFILVRRNSFATAICGRTASSDCYFHKKIGAGCGGQEKS